MPRIQNSSPTRNVPASDFEIDLQHVAEVLSKIKNPWVRYQLTMIIDLYAAKLEAEQEAGRLARKKKPSRKKKTAREKKTAPRRKQR